MASIEFAPGQHHSEQFDIHVLWMSSGLSCDGESVAFTSATEPSLEDIIRGTIPGMPHVTTYWPILSYQSGAEFMKYWHDAAAGKLDPFILILEGSVPNEFISGDGHWAGLGTNVLGGQPITTNEWLDRLAPKAVAVIALGTCATYGGVHAMKNNPTGAMGACDYLGWGWVSRAGLPVINVPGCPAQPDNMTETLTIVLMALVGMTPVPHLDDQHRLVAHFGRTVHERCNRAGFYEHGDFATRYGADDRCLVKLGCKGPVSKCNVPLRGWIGGIGGCPNVGGICIGCTMPGFPDKYMSFMDADTEAIQSSTIATFTYGPLVRHLRNRLIDTFYDKEPGWRGLVSTLPPEYLTAWADPGVAEGRPEASGRRRAVAFGASMPEVVAVGALAQVDVVLSLEALSEGEKDLPPLQPVAPLILEILPRHGFAVRGHDQLATAVPSKGEPATFMFFVEALHVGPGEVWALLSQGQIPLGRLTLRAEVVETASVSTKTTTPLALQSESSELTRFTIYERELPGAGVIYDYGIEVPSLGIFRRFESPVIKGDRDAYVEHLYSEIEKLTRRPDSVAELESRLRMFGGELYDELLPRELRELLWINRHRISDVMVVSTEPFIPWELLHLKPAEGPLPHEVYFLAQVGLVRWRWGTSPPARISVRRSRCRYVMPEYGSLDAARDERRFLEHEIGATAIAPKWTSVRDALGEREGFDLLHFGVSGRLSGSLDAPNRRGCRIFVSQ